jgi:hypothetical protein
MSTDASPSTGHQHRRRPGHTPTFNWVGFEPASLEVDAIEHRVTCLYRLRAGFAPVCAQMSGEVLR